jgi:hypothetical protein
MHQKRRMQRPFLFAALLLAAGCGSSPGGSREAALAAAGKVECAVEGAATFEPICTVERMSGPEGLSLTLRSPSGSFRRLLVTTDGRGVVAADGAEQAVVTPLADNRIEVVLAGDRYRLPATVKP